MIDVLARVPLYVLPFLLVLTLVVTVHELGHFWVARAFRVKIDRFAVGFGRGLVSRVDRHGTEWRLGWIPLGGYVKFSGDLDPSSVPDQAGLAELKSRIVAEHGPKAVDDYFHFKPVWQRALIVVAGPVANFILAIVIFALFYGFVGNVIQPARVAQVMPDTPAAAAGFQSGDLITAINGRRVEDGHDVITRVSLSSGERLRFTVEREGRVVTLFAVPQRQVTEDAVAGRVSIGRIGLGLAPNAGEVRYIRHDPVSAVAQGFRQTGKVLSTSLHYIGRLVTGRENGDQLSGPLGMARVSGTLANAAVDATPDTGAQARNMLMVMAQFAAILSIGIGFLNLLPIPILDGGHLVFYGYEAVARKPVAARYQEAGFRLGLALLACFMLFATWNDLQKLNLFKFLGGLAS